MTDLTTKLAKLYHAANATFSDADHMFRDVPVDEAARYFRRHRETLDVSIRNLRAAFHEIEELTKEDDT